MNNTLLILGTIILVSLVFSVTAIIISRRFKISKYKKEIDSLDIAKNQIIGVPILSEITKVREMVKTDNLKKKLEEWENTFKSIKEDRVPKLSEMIAEADFLLNKKDYKLVIKKIANIEMEIKELQNISKLLIDEIKIITNSEERNRSIVTKLKVSYRELKHKFERTIKDYGEIKVPLTLEFDNMTKLFQDFEDEMDNNDYVSVEKVVYALEEKINSMKTLLEEIPGVVLLATIVLPKKIEDITTIYTRMIRDSYPLDYLNVEYNIKEVNKKIEVIMDNLRLLKVNDSIVELKTMLAYFDTLITDFDKERDSKDIFNENMKILKKRIEKLNKNVYDIYVGLDDIKTTYDLKEDDIKKFYYISEELESYNEDYNTLYKHGKGKTFAYSKLVEEEEGLGNKLSRLQDDLDFQLQSITSMKDDEHRAREQLNDIQKLLKQTQIKMKSYKLPVIPNSYFMELTEAGEAIKEIKKELERKPIAIKVLNIRVDTARDLVFKIHNKTNEILKLAMIDEQLIVYGNRYRSNYHEVKKGLEKAEETFNRGLYKQSLEFALQAISFVEPDIKKRFDLKFGANSS